MARNLFRSFVRRGASSIAKLDLTVKSHKGAGFMTFRNIHRLACYSLEGLSQWGCAGTQILAAHAMSSPQGHTTVCETHKYQVRKT